MSATGRSDVRRADDFYVTPAWCTRAIWPHLSAYTTCLDPCAGEGAILKALQELAQSPSYYAIELDEDRARKCPAQSIVWGDALASHVNWGINVDLIITNPPFSLAQEFLEKALASGAKEIAFLLRLNYLGSMTRAAFWKKNACDIYVLPKRPSFAIFLSCKKNRFAGVVAGEKGCGWKESYPLNAELPTSCPMCGNASLTKCTSDATEYAWYVWRSSRPYVSVGRWQILDIAP